MSQIIADYGFGNREHLNRDAIESAMSCCPLASPKHRPAKDQRLSLAYKFYNSDMQTPVNKYAFYVSGGASNANALQQVIKSGYSEWKLSCGKKSLTQCQLRVGKA